MDKVVICRSGNGWTYVDSGKAEYLEAVYKEPQYEGYRIIDEDKLDLYLSRQGLLLAVTEAEGLAEEVANEAENDNQIFGNTANSIISATLTTYKNRLLKLLKETE